MEQIIRANGFTLVKETPVPEMEGRLLEMAHTGSGARLVWLDRPDENMTFAIGFRTVPTDSTGVFHILEHSVLGGSEQYPVKEPFLELIKSSLQTFLNAMTFPDKTVYPVSSRNRQDFLNLMAVYMDAVLHPLAIRNPRIFRQEGWRLERNEQGEPYFQGVVYNEMKGAFSDVNRTLDNVMTAHLFPDSCYRFVSGGDPASIPSLSFSQFVSEHARYYHPSNALIALDGSIDLEACLHFLDTCLRPYRREDLSFPIAMQVPLPFSQATVPYEIGAEESTAEKTIVAFGKLLCDFTDPCQQYAADMLADYLAGSNEAPLKRAVLDAGLGEDFSVYAQTGTQQAWFGWDVRNTEADKADAIRSVIRGKVEEILAAGLDRDRLLGCYNSMAFHLMDRDNNGYPRGLTEVLNILEPWLYGGDPAQNLAYRTILEDLRQRMDTDYFADLLRRCLLDDSTGFLAILVPDPALGQQRVAAEKQRAHHYWDGLTSQEQQALLAELEDVHTWQQTPNTEEELQSIPMLRLEDLDKTPAPLACSCQDQDGIPVLSHAVATDLNYITLFFAADDLLPEELPAASLLADMLGQLATESRSASQLQIRISQILGEMHVSIESYALDALHHRSLVACRAACLPAYRTEAAKLIIELLTSTVFTDRNALREELRQQKLFGQRNIVRAGNRYAAARVLSRESSCGAARELLAGFENLRWTAAASNWEDTGLDALLLQMKALSAKLFVRARLTLSVSRNAEDILPLLAQAFPQGSCCPAASASYPAGASCREAIRIPAAVGFAAAGTQLSRTDTPYSGSMFVLSNLLTYEYLWNAVRVQGGAYGTGFRADNTGDVIATSYRDPAPGRSLACFHDCADFVRKAADSGMDLTRFILGAVSDAEPLQGAATKKRRAEARYFRGIDEQTAAARYRQLLETTASDLLTACGALTVLADRGNSCIVAGAEQLAACENTIDVILDMPE